MLLMKLPSVSGHLRFLFPPFTKVAGRLRRFACFSRKLPTVSGFLHPRSRKLRDVSGGLHAHDENCRQSQALSTFCARRARKWRGVSGGLHVAHETAERLRPFAFFVPAIHESGGTSQAVCVFFKKIADRFRLFAPAVTKIAGRLRRFACP